MTCEEIIIKLRNIETGIGSILTALNPLTLLKSIDASLKKLSGDGESSYQDIWFGWNRTRHGNHVFYTKDITLTGTTQTEQLPLDKVLLQLNRIGMYFNSANARTFNIKVYNTVTATYYNTLDIQTGHVSDSRLIQFGTEWKFSPHKLEWNFSSYTPNDIVSIEVQVDEL